jgi:hypothetical protein
MCALTDLIKQRRCWIRRAPRAHAPTRSICESGCAGVGMRPRRNASPASRRPSRVGRRPSRGRRPPRDSARRWPRRCSAALADARRRPRPAPPPSGPRRATRGRLEHRIVGELLVQGAPLRAPSPQPPLRPAAAATVALAQRCRDARQSVRCEAALPRPVAPDRPRQAIAEGGKASKRGRRQRHAGRRRALPPGLPAVRTRCRAPCWRKCNPAVRRCARGAENLVRVPARRTLGSTRLHELESSRKTAGVTDGPLQISREMQPGRAAFGPAPRQRRGAGSASRRALVPLEPAARRGQI